MTFQKWLLDYFIPRNALFHWCCHDNLANFAWKYHANYYFWGSREKIIGLFALLILLLHCFIIIKIEHGNHSTILIFKNIGFQGVHWWTLVWKNTACCPNKSTHIKWIEIPTSLPISSFPELKCLLPEPTCLLTFTKWVQ